MKYKLIKDPIYKAAVHILLNCSSDEREKKYRKLFPKLKKEINPSHKAEVCRFVHDNGFVEYALHIIDANPKNADTLYTIVHEASHLVDKIFSDRGVGGDTEARAYYLEYWVMQIWRFAGK